MLNTAEELLLSTKLEKKASGEYSIAEKSIIGLLSMFFLSNSAVILV
jgi:hypothetical protein